MRTPDVRAGWVRVSAAPPRARERAPRCCDPAAALLVGADGGSAFAAIEGASAPFAAGSGSGEGAGSGEGVAICASRCGPDGACAAGGLAAGRVLG